MEKNKMIKKLLLILLCLPFTIFGQGWEKTYGGGNECWGFSVQQTTDGGYIVCGVKSSGSPNWSDVYLIKTDGNGDSLWTKTYGGIDWDQGYCVQQTSDGGYIITGRKTTSHLNPDYDIYLIKTDGNGIEQWNQTFGGIGNDLGLSVQQTTDGGYIITGSTYSGGNLIKTDSQGDSLWTKTYGPGPGYLVQQTTDGGYIITGYTNGDSLQNGDVFLIKTDGNGDSLWTQTYGDTDLEQGFSVQQTTDGGYIITGRKCSSGNSGCNIYLIKTNSQGNITSTFNIPTPSSNRKLKKVVDILGREIKPQPNTPFIEIYDDGTVEKRIVIE